MTWLQGRRASGQVKPFASLPRLDWTHPLARGLVSYCYDDGNVYVDLVTGKRSQETNTAGGVEAVRQSTKFGNASVFNASAEVQFLPSTSKFATLTNTANYSFACSWMNAVIPASVAAWWNSGDATTNTCFQIGGGLVAVDDVFWSWANDAGHASAAGTNTVNVFHTALGVTLTASTGLCYIDGKLSISPTGMATTRTQAGVQPQLGVCDTAIPQPRAFTGSVYYGAAWLRQLTASEARLLHDDPWGLLIYPEDEMFTELVGVTAGIADNPGMTAYFKRRGFSGGYAGGW